MIKADTPEIKDEKQAYELGFLLSPLVVADQAVATVDKLLKSALLAIGGEVEREEAPQLIPLAYPLKRTIDNRGTIFREAYFGVIYFRAEPLAMASLETDWQCLPELVRHLLIRRSPADLRWHANQAALATRPALARTSLPAGEKMSDKINEEAIDKEIEGLLAETSTAAAK